MINQKENTIKALGTALIIVLFLFFCSVFSDKSFDQQGHNSQLGSTTEFNANNGKAIVADIIKCPSLQKSGFLLLRNLFNENNKAIADSRKFNPTYTLLKETRISIKPLFLFRFYYHLFSYDSDDLPFLT